MSVACRHTHTAIDSKLQYFWVILGAMFAVYKDTAVLLTSRPRCHGPRPALASISCFTDISHTWKDRNGTA